MKGQGGLKPEEEILDGDKLREKLESALPHAQESIVFISAYITQSAIDWFIKYAPKNTDKHIVCRLIPSDVLTGATQLSALKTALNKGILVSCLHSLHAKIYAIDSQTIFVGSANLTNNGLKIYGSGNLEACSQVPANNLNLSFIQNIVDSSTPLDTEIVQNMQGCIDLKEASVFFDRWPEGVLKEQEGIWVRDFFWARPDILVDSAEQIHDFELLGIRSAASADEISKQQVLQARCIRWLLTKLKTAPEKELYFGFLTKILHDELRDDPEPYRKDVKSLVQNLLAYCQKYLPDLIDISQPNYSQRIKLIISE